MDTRTDVRYESDSLNNSFENSAVDEPSAPDDDTLRSSDFEVLMEWLKTAESESMTQQPKIKGNT